MGVKFFCDFCGAVGSEENPIYSISKECNMMPNNGGIYLDGPAGHNNKMVCQKCLDRLRFKPIVTGDPLTDDNGFPWGRVCDD